MYENAGMDVARNDVMQGPSPNRPPRSKRPPEIVRHVNETMEAYRRMVGTQKEARPPTGPRPDVPKT